MAGTIVVDRIESDASYASNINVASQVTFSNTVNVAGQTTFSNTVNFGAYNGTAPVAGLYLPTTNNLAFTTASTERMRIDPSGNPIFTNAFDKIFSITASVASNALTVTLNPCALDFRSSTLTSGTIVTRTVTSAISVTVSSGSTLGTVSAQQSRIVVLAIDNAGTVELAVVNISGGNQLDETNLISTTAEGGAGAADSASVIYSTTARTSVAYRVIGFIQSTQTTAGTWATAPSTIQGIGGQALAALSSIGYGQTWTNVIGSRISATTYYNTTGKPIMVIAASTNSGGAVSGASISAIVQGTTIVSASTNATYSNPNVSFIVPSGSSYSVSSAGGALGLGSWFELR